MKIFEIAFLFLDEIFFIPNEILLVRKVVYKQFSFFKGDKVNVQSFKINFLKSENIQK